MNAHKKASIALVKRHPEALLAVAVPNKAKAPHTKTDFSGTDALIRSATALKKVEGGSDVLGAVLRGQWVDVDLDEENPVLEAALSTFVQTPFVFGRNSKPRSHFFVYLDEDFSKRDRRFEFMRTVRRLNLNMELRGHAENTSQHTNMPGGHHETGEVTTWFDLPTVEAALQATPPQTKVANFAKALRKAIVASVMVHHWNDGSRHALSLGLAGLLAKNCIAAQLDVDAPLADVVLDLADLYSIIDFICDQTDDTEKVDRRKAVKGTWAKAEKGGEVAGYKTLVDHMGEEPAKLLRVSLAGSAFMDRLEELNEKIAYIPKENAFVCLDEIDKYGIVSRTGPQYKMHLPDHEIVLPGAKPVRMHAATALRRYQLTRDVSSIEPVPNGSALMANPNIPGTFILNSFPGWMTEPWPDALPDDDEVKKFISQHILKVIADGDEGLADWITMFFADIVQNPVHKPGTALILVGNPGAGKSSLVGILAGALGARLQAVPGAKPPLYTVADTLDRVTAKFNAQLEGQLLIQLEEVMHHAEGRSTAALNTLSVLRSLVTNTHIMIEPKSREVRRVMDMARYIFTSQSLDRALKIDVNDRRFTVARVSDTRKDDWTYWKKVYALVATADYPKKCFRYLLDYPVDKSKLSRPYTTEARDITVAATNSRDEAAAELNFALHLILTEGHPLDEGLQDAHWEATIRPALRRYSKQFSRQLWRESWPELVHAGYFARCFSAYMAKDMRIGGKNLSSVRLQFVFKLCAQPEIQQHRVNHRVRPPKEEERRTTRVRLRTLPTRRELYAWVADKTYLEPAQVEEIEALIELDETYTYAPQETEQF